MKINQHLSKCLVVTNYRTGSTNFCIDNAQTYRLDCEYEIINIHGLDNAINSLQRNQNIICKIMPDQFNFDTEQFAKMYKSAHQVVYLYRKDFKAQCLSWIGWNQSGNTSHRHGENKTFQIDCTQDQANEYADTLIKNYDYIKSIYKQYPGTIYAYEDIQTGLPYNRNYIWSQSVDIPDYNTEWFEETQ